MRHCPLPGDPCLITIKMDTLNKKAISNSAKKKCECQQSPNSPNKQKNETISIGEKNCTTGGPQLSKSAVQTVFNLTLSQQYKTKRTRSEVDFARRRCLRTFTRYLTIKKPARNTDNLQLDIQVYFHCTYLYLKNTT